MKYYELSNKTVLITGVAGFIGASLAEKLLDTIPMIRIIGIDNLDTFNDISLKRYRLDKIEKLAQKNPYNSWFFLKGDISDKIALENIFQIYKPDCVVNLAGETNISYSLINPDAFVSSNVVGFYNVLEACRCSYENGEGVKHLVYASSASVYKENEKAPNKIEDRVDEPVNLYAATKKSNELFAYSYSKLYGIQTTGLRFFTVYGPAGRSDMVYYNFAQKMVNREKMKFFNYGKSKRDFIYIDDVVDCIKRVLQSIPEKKYKKDGEAETPYNLYNIGTSHPVEILEFADVLKKEMVRIGILQDDYNFDDYKVMLPAQLGDVTQTYADISKFEEDFGFMSFTPLSQGLGKFVEWYKDFYNL